MPRGRGYRRSFRRGRRSFRRRSFRRGVRKLRVGYRM